MSKISELGPITGINTRTEDLFVVVNLIQGDDGTKNITRRELAEALQYETWSHVIITGGTISNVTMSASIINDTEINDPLINDGTINRSIYNNADIRTGTARDLQISNSDITTSDITNSTLDDVTGDDVRLVNSTFSGVISNSTIETSDIEDSTMSNSAIFDSTANNVTITNSLFDDGNISDTFANTMTITASTFESGAILDSTANNITITSSTATDFDIDTGTANNITITNSDIANSDFSDGTGNNNVFTNTEIDNSDIANSTITDTAFQGTMNNVVAQNMQISSSTATGMSSRKSTFDNGAITNSTFEGGTVAGVDLKEFDMDLSQSWEPQMDENSYFAIKNEKTGETEKITYAQFFDEISKSVNSALKIYVSPDGDDKNPGTVLQPIRTLERASELAFEKAGGTFDRNNINNAVHITCGPGTYYTKGNIPLPDDCALTSSAGQYATVIELEEGYEYNNGILVGSGNYVQGFAFQNFRVDNFDYPERGFAVAYRPNALLRRSPYIRDSSQLSNFNRLDVEPPLQPFNTRGTIADLGQQIFIENVDETNGSFAEGDEITFGNGSYGIISRVDEKDSENCIYVRNIYPDPRDLDVGDSFEAESGGTGSIQSLGIDDFPNPLVGRGGGCMLADRRVLDSDSLFTYVLCFGFTPRSQNGMGYVARNGAGINGIGSLSIFVRTAFYALEGGQMTLNNSGTQFGDISMRAKGSTAIFQPSSTANTNITGNTVFGDTILAEKENIIDDMVDYLSTPVSAGGLGYTFYDSEKCRRDSGIIVDSVGYDVLTGSNYWGRLNGITYRSPISQIVYGEQLDETVGSIRHLQDKIEDIFTDANVNILNRANTSIDETINVLEDGEENMADIVWVDTGNQGWTNAREQLQEHRDYIIEEFVDWLDNNENWFAYDGAKCRRDVKDYILPAVKYDMLLDTNYNSITAGNAYYFKQSEKVIQEQRNETVAAYKHLKAETSDIIEDGNSNAAMYDATVAADEAFDEIINILDNKYQIFTPSHATYDPITGETVLTLGKGHGLEIGQKILLTPESITFNCGDPAETISHPRTTDPAYQNGVSISHVTDTTITLDVGDAKGYTGDHVFVSAEDDCVRLLNNTFTPTDATYDPVTGVMEVTIGEHALKVGKYVEIVENGITFSCPDGNGNPIEISHPRATDPIHKTPVMITGITGTTITLNVGDAGGYTGVHTFVSALPHAISLVGSGIVFSDNSAISADRRNARKQLQANKEFIQDYMMGWIDYNYFVYDSAKCSRDISSYILPAVQRDMVIGTNFNAVQSGIAYRQGTASAVVNDQLTETVGAWTELKAEIGNSVLTTNTAIASSDLAIDEVINVLQNGEDAANTVIWPAHNYKAWKTPTTATYDPTTGVSEITIGQHDLAVGDYVEVMPYALTFTCSQDGDATEHSYPRFGDGNYKTAVEITANTATTITVNVGAGSGGTHTFVRAIDGGVGVLTNNKDARNARAQLLANRTFIQDEIKAYLDYNYFTYDKEKCSRDVGLILDAVKRDVATGSNFNSVFAGLAYRSGNASANTVINEQLTETAAALNWVKGEIGDKLTGAALTRSDAAFDEIIDIMTNGTGNADPINFGYTPSDSNREIAANVLQLNKEFLKAEATAWIAVNYPSLTYDTAKCERDIGYLVDSVTWDISHASNAASINNARLYFDNAVAILPEDQRLPTFEAFKHIARVAELCVLDQAVVPSTGNAEVQDTSNSAVSNIIGNQVQQKFMIVADAIKSAEFRFPDYDEPTAETGYGTIPSLFDGNKSALQARVIKYLTDNQNGLGYDEDLCYRDVGYIVDAVAKDIEFGGDVNTVEAANYYFINAANLLPMDQRIPTQEAYEHLASIVEDVVTETIISKTSGNPSNQDTTGTAASAATGAAAKALVEIISDAVVQNTSEDIKKPVKPVVDMNGYFAREQLQNNKAFLQKEITAYLNKNYYTYDKDLCQRDTGYIMEAVARDVKTGSNFNSIQNAICYRSGMTSTDKVINEQLNETIGAWTHVKSRLASKLSDDNVLTTTNAAFDEIFDIMSNGESAADTIIWGDAWLSSNALAARFQLQQNKAFMIAEITAWIAVNYPSLSYDVAKCERDTGYLIDALSYDMQHGSNTSTRLIARMYFTGSGVSVLGAAERAPTAAAFGRLATVAEQVVQEIAVTKSAGNALNQDFSLTAASATEGTRVNELATIVSDVITAGGISGMPAAIEPSAAYVSASVNGSTIINNFIDTAKTEIITYLRNNHNGLGYQADKCERDVGYIVDAISHDLQYTGNAATWNAAQIYFVGAMNLLEVDEREPSKLAFTHLANVMRDVVFGAEVTKTEGNAETQDRTAIMGNNVIAKRAKDLAMIIANVVDDPTSAHVPLREEPDLDHFEGYGNYAQKYLIEDNVTELSEHTINYISTTYNGLSYNSEKCRRDMGIIVDAISHDVQYWGNIATKIAANMYFENGNSVLPFDSRTQTADTFATMATLVNGVILENDVANTTFTSTAQDTTGTPATSTEADFATDMVEIIEDVIRNNTLDVMPEDDEYDLSWVDANLITASEKIDDNDAQLAEEVTDYINRTFTVLDYNKAKCRRDAGYLIDGFSYDLNFGGNAASRWNAEFYFWNNILRIPENQRVQTGQSYRYLGELCSEIIGGTKLGAPASTKGYGTPTEVAKVKDLANIYYLTLINNDTKLLPKLEEPDASWQESYFVEAKEILESKRAALQDDTVRFVSAQYKFIDRALTRRDAGNLLTGMADDFKYTNTTGSTPVEGSQRSTRTLTSSFFEYDGTLVFPILNTSVRGLKYKGSVERVTGTTDYTGLNDITNPKKNWAYIVAGDDYTNAFDGTVYYWNGTGWTNAGANNTELLDSFVGAWQRMRDYMTGVAPGAPAGGLGGGTAENTMVNALFNDVLIKDVLNPQTLVFGSLVESIAHQFNGASAGVNRNALPLNFRNLGQPISALASVLYEDGGRVRWSGADELNNQYFARGLRINGRTGRIEGRPFTSSVRKLARRASNSRAIV